MGSVGQFQAVLICTLFSNETSFENNVGIDVSITM